MTIMYPQLKRVLERRVPDWSWRGAQAKTHGSPHAQVLPCMRASCTRRGVRPIKLCSAGSSRGYRGVYPDTAKVAMQRLL